MLVKSPTQQQQYQDLKSKPEFQQTIKENIWKSEICKRWGLIDVNDYIARISLAEVNPMTGDIMIVIEPEVFYPWNKYIWCFNDNRLLFVTNNKDDASTFTLLENQI